MAAAAARLSRTARSLSVTRARTPPARLMFPSSDAPSSGDVAIDVPSGVDVRADQAADAVDAPVERHCRNRFGPHLHHPDGHPGSRRHHLVVLLRHRGLHSPRSGEPELGWRPTVQAGVEQLHVAGRMVLVRRRRRAVRRHLPGLGGQPGQPDPGGGLRVGELLRRLSPGRRTVRGRHQLVLCRLAVHRRLVRGLRARRTVVHGDRRVLLRDVPERIVCSAPSAASVSPRPAARRVNAATGAASAPSIRSCATPAA